MEQQRVKRERLADFEMQRILEAEYKKEQTVRESTGDAAAGAGGAGVGGR
jgi:protein PET117